MPKDSVSNPQGTEFGLAFGLTHRSVLLGCAHGLLLDPSSVFHIGGLDVSPDRVIGNGWSLVGRDAINLLHIVVVVEGTRRRDVRLGGGLRFALLVERVVCLGWDRGHVAEWSMCDLAYELTGRKQN